MICFDLSFLLFIYVYTAVTAFLHQYYTESDLQQFYTKYFPELEGVAIAEVKTPTMWQPKYEYELLVIYVIVAHIMNS